MIFELIKLTKPEFLTIWCHAILELWMWALTKKSKEGHSTPYTVLWHFSWRLLDIGVICQNTSLANYLGSAILLYLYIYLELYLALLQAIRTLKCNTNSVMETLNNCFFGKYLPQYFHLGFSQHSCTMELAMEPYHFLGHPSGRVLIFLQLKGRDHL